MTKIYIPHYTKLTKRKKEIIRTCTELNKEFTIITNYDKESLINNDTLDQENEWVKRIKEIEFILLKNAGISSGNNINCPWLTPRKLKPAEISLTYKHFLALMSISIEGEPGIVFEDDVGTIEGSKENLKRAERIIKEGFDYIDLAGGCSLPIYSSDCKVDLEPNFIKTNPPRSRTTAGYIVNPSAAYKIAQNLFPAILPLDWSFQYIFVKESMNVGWIEPPVFLHGSQSNDESSIQDDV